ncbi:hypothetical protein HanXRQr2_Chr04g0186151 [Helianthus annuus]|uniref:Uncharacterized protein n=1 Tax=Helianthus annuus TaxID=4232 RepID=A0A251V4M3_HELAN|nr:uncharacterized protein LOC110937795 isoform X2 [Helianthus annuus]KAF5811848.1 hypothetical protein HanXRQr2_Chr04g0186151 [Helianthus annuus]
MSSNEDPSTILMFLTIYLLHNCTCISCNFPFSRTWCSRGRGREWSLLHMGRRVHCLTTTAPEQLTFALQWSMKPLAYVGVPVAKVILTLILLLRFSNLVFY